MKKRVEPKAIREIMTASPITVYPDASIRELKILFERYQVNALPVVDERGVLRGIVSRRDVLGVFRPDPRRPLSSLFALGAERAEEIMSRGVDAVGPEDPVATAVDLMLTAGRRSLPVVERRPVGPVLVGMVSRTDLFPCLTLAAEESPAGGGAHRPGPASLPQLPRRLGRSRGGRGVVKALAARVGGVLEAIVPRALIPRGRQCRQEPKGRRTGEIHAQDAPLPSLRAPWARRHGTARQGAAVHAD
jgi:CBS domain-containing protein